jgi:magnesium transporter
VLTTYYLQDGHLHEGAEGDLRQAIWIDLLEPSREEEQRLEALLDVEIPTRDEMREVESSSALYRENDFTFVTVRVVLQEDLQQPRLTSMTLVLGKGHFITVRYATPRAFTQFLGRTQRTGTTFSTPLSAMLCLLETIVDRNADTLEEIADSLEPISAQIFSQNTSDSSAIAAADLGKVLNRIGTRGELASRVRESLHSVGRAVPFIQLHMTENGEVTNRVKTLARDVHSLLEHDNFLQTQIQFLLDSSVGLISIQQNAIMKAVSIAAVIFLPATLIGSIYGMNFDHMPELHWKYGYAWALSLMAASALCPLIYFKIKRWF